MLKDILKIDDRQVLAASPHTIGILVKQQKGIL